MHNLSNKKILITGGLGFIGSFLIKELSKKDNEIVVLDACPVQNSSAYEMNVLDDVTVIQGSILDDELLATLPNDFNYIIHAAGVLGIKTVVEKPFLTAEVNVFGTRKILDLALRQKDLKRFILFSTSEVYGQFCSGASEDAPAVIPNVGMRWVYASSKHFTEYLLKSYINDFNLPGVIVRPFNVYGPFRKGSNAMSTLIRNAIEGSSIILSGDGKQSRAWCHVDDFIYGLLQCLSVDGIIGEAFNLGNDQEPVSMIELSQKICSITQSKSRIIIAGGDAEDVLQRAPNIEKARRMLGYNPKIALADGINGVAQWITESTLALR